LQTEKEIPEEEEGFLLNTGQIGLLEDPRIRERLFGTNRLCQGKLDLQFDGCGSEDSSPGRKRLQAVF